MPGGCQHGHSGGQVWATDITDIPLQNRFLVLVVFVQLFWRSGLSWKNANLTSSIQIKIVNLSSPPS
jgi:hypothetical protein